MLKVLLRAYKSQESNDMDDVEAEPQVNGPGDLEAKIDEPWAEPEE